VLGGGTGSGFGDASADATGGAAACGVTVSDVSNDAPSLSIAELTGEGTASPGVSGTNIDSDLGVLSVWVARRSANPNPSAITTALPATHRRAPTMRRGVGVDRTLGTGASKRSRRDAR
jgi:hypothetical protein